MYDVSGNDASSGTVLSIFGFGKGGNDCFGNKLEAFVNQQKGSTIYLNSKLYLSGTGSDSSSELQNAGRLYVNGEIHCPNLVSAWLTGSYDYGKTLAEDYVQGTYTSETPKYSGLTYCQGCFDAPKATVNVGDKHFVFVEDALTENFDGTGTLNQNINVKKVSMWGESMFYAPNQADISETVDVSGTAIFNVQNQVNAQGTNIADGSGGQIVAPVEVEITDGKDANLTGLSNVVFERGITTSSLRGTRVEIKIKGDLVVNGPINLTRSKLIVTGVIRCKSMTLAASMVSCGSTLTVANGSVGGALTMTNGSRMNVESNLVNVGAIDFNNGGMFVKGEISTASSIKLANGSRLITRNTERDNEGNHEGNHRNNINLGGTTVVESGSKLFVDGKLNTTEVTVKGASKLYAYTGIYFANIANISIDITNHGEENSEVFLGEDNTRDDIKYNLYVDGTLYLPDKHFGRYTNMYTKVDIRNNGIVICDGNISTDYIQVGSDSGASGKALLFVAGRTTLKGDCTYTNYGRLYAYGGTDITDAHKGAQNTTDFNLLQDNSDTYLGTIKNGNSEGTLDCVGYFEGHGDIFIDGNLNVGNNCSNHKVDDRYTSIYIPNGTTYVSGNVTIPDNNAVLTEKGAGLVVQKDFTMGCAIWNFGKIHIYGAFTMHQDVEYPTSKGQRNKDGSYPNTVNSDGWSILNGEESDEGKNESASFKQASFIAYNNGQKGDMMLMRGRMMNFGQIYMNYGVDVQGCMNDNYTYKPEGEKIGKGQNDNNKKVRYYAFVNYVGAKAHFAGLFRCNTRCFMNKWDAEFGCDGKLTYGVCAYNMGKMYVGGDLTNNETSQDTFRAGHEYRDNKSGSLLGVNFAPDSDSFDFSFMNGLMGIGDYTSDDKGKKVNIERTGGKLIFENAELYVGGDLQVGSSEKNADSGSVINVGTMYIKKNLYVYGDGGQAGRGKFLGDTGTVYYQTALWCPTNSNTFVGGEVVAGGAVATGKNTIFMCDSDFRARKAAKLNMWFRFYNASTFTGNVVNYFEDDTWDTRGYGDADVYKSCYMRVGGNMYTNVEGRDLHSGLFSGDLGKLINKITGGKGDKVPCDNSRDMDIQANSNIFIGGGFYCPQQLFIKRNATLIVANASSNGETIIDSDNHLNWKCRALYQDSSDADKNNPTVYDTSITDRIRNFLQDFLHTIVTGKNKFNIDKQYAFFEYQLLDVDICSTFVVNGDAFVRDTCKIRDMTKTYIYGDFDVNEYLEVGKSQNDTIEDATEARLDKYKLPYENDTDYVFSNAGYMYVKGNTEVARYIKIFASTSIKVGGNMTTSSIVDGYITLRHDATVSVGGNMNAATSIDCGAYSEAYVNGNMTATHSNIKLRDQMTCFVGGDLTAWSYLELGKFDANFYRGVKNNRVREYLNQAEDAHASERENQNGYSDKGATEGDNYHYTDDEQERNDNEPAGGAPDDNEQETEDSIVDSNQQFVKEELEMANDSSDLAVGSSFYINGNIWSITSYIKEYAFSQIVGGGYIVSTDYITLRHNADMWVLPEVFEHYECTNCKNTAYKAWQDACPKCGSTGTMEKTENQTYHFVPLQGEAKNNWERIVAALRQIYENGRPKQGSIYSLGELTMNKNSSIFATRDLIPLGQMVMRKGTLAFLGHDFICRAPNYNTQAPDFSSVEGFLNWAKDNLGLTENKPFRGFVTKDDSQKANGTAELPIVIYANNKIEISTTAQISYTYLISNRGNVEFNNLNPGVTASTSSTILDDAKELTNAFGSYQGDVNYYARFDPLGALMYAPQGRVKVDGYKYDFYGSMIGNTVDIKTFYINIHRFNNWRTMNLEMATAEKSYLISERKYNEYLENNSLMEIEDSYIYGYEKDYDPNIDWYFPGISDAETPGTEDGDTDETPSF